MWWLGYRRCGGLRTVTVFAGRPHKFIGEIPTLNDKITIGVAKFRHWGVSEPIKDHSWAESMNVGFGLGKNRRFMGPFIAIEGLLSKQGGRIDHAGVRVAFKTKN